MKPRSPRLARWILERVLPTDMRPHVPDDLEEMFLRQRAVRGSVRARLWYYRQAIVFPVHLMADRLRAWVPLDMNIGTSLIDLKLAVRMLVRYPGLTVVGVVGMAVGIAISAGAYAIGHALLNPSLPLVDGDRIVSICQWDTRRNDRTASVLHDFLSWRSDLSSIKEVGAFRAVSRNLIAPGAPPETVSIAEMSASGFRIARVAPLLGRHLLPEDEESGAPEVVVIGEDVWRRRFAADPAILGREVQLGATTHAIVGIMPSGFGFPIDHSFWIPLPLPATAQPVTGLELRVFGRLAADATLDSAQTELSIIGQRTSAASPKTHEYLRPRVLPYTYAFSDMGRIENSLTVRAAQTLIVMLLLVVCVNVAILVYARTATRQGEIAVRTALGASRRRIVSQLFLEALVLAAVAAGIGTVLASTALEQLTTGLLQLGAGLPFWLDFQLTAEGLVFVVGLTILAAAVVGVVPALKATGRRVQTRLQGLSAGSGSRMQMGRLWTTLIVTQVAIAVAVLPATVYYAWDTLRFRTADRGFASHEFLTADLYMDRPSFAAENAAAEKDFTSKYAARQAELRRTIETESPVVATTFSLASPGGELAAVLEAEGIAPPPDPVDYNIVNGSKLGYLVRFNRIGIDFFDAYDVPVLMGRGFRAGDLTGGAHPVLINRTFAEQIFGGASPLGRRVRYVGISREAGEDHIAMDRWHEVVGVVKDFPPYAMHDDGSDARLYHPAAAGDVYPALLAVRVRGAEPSSFTGRLREISAKVDPSFQLRNMATAEDAIRREQRLMRLIGVILGAVTLSVLVLATAGIYALMSFTVARRRREIGIRIALGADSRQILLGIFARAFGQLAIGAALGTLIAVALDQVLHGGPFEKNGAIVLPAVALFTTVVGLLAALGPARRGLRIQPTEALREE